jgi:hypothetical protein
MIFIRIFKKSRRRGGEVLAAFFIFSEASQSMGASARLRVAGIVVLAELWL